MRSRPVIAATAPTESNGDHAAGGLSGKNETTRLPQAGSGESTSSSGASGSAFPTGGSGMYRDNTNIDTVARAANQSQAAEVANNKARTAWVKPVVRSVTPIKQTRSGGFWISFENAVYQS